MSEYSRIRRAEGEWGTGGSEYSAFFKETCLKNVKRARGEIVMLKSGIGVGVLIC